MSRKLFTVVSNSGPENQILIYIIIVISWLKISWLHTEINDEKQIIPIFGDVWFHQINLPGLSSPSPHEIMPVLWEEEDITVRGRQQKSVRQYHGEIPPCEIVVVVWCLVAVREMN